MGSLIYSNIQPGSWGVTADSGSVRDLEGLFVTRKRGICFHGTERQLVEAFPVGGKGCPSSNGGGREENMLCAGVVSSSLVEGTAEDPHWDAEVQWVGIHTAHTAATDKTGKGYTLFSPTFNYRILCNVARTETQFPKTVTNAGADFAIGAGFEFVNVGAVTTAAFPRARLINFVPALQIIGVIRDDTGWLTPFNPQIKGLITALNGTHAPSAGSGLQDWSKLPDPLYTYANTFLPKSKQQGAQGGYVPTSMQSHRHLSFGPIHAFTLDLAWEQGISPG